MKKSDKPTKWRISVNVDKVAYFKSKEEMVRYFSEMVEGAEKDILVITVTKV